MAWLILQCSPLLLLLLLLPDLVTAGQHDAASRCAAEHGELLQQVKRDLAPWQQSGITAATRDVTLAHVRKAYKPEAVSGTDTARTWQVNPPFQNCG